MAKNTVAPGTDATAIAAIHWFALTIERSALQSYITDGSQLAKIETILSAAVSALGKVHAAPPIGGDDPCPKGWKMCQEMCLPDCDAQSGKPRARS